MSESPPLMMHRRGGMLVPHGPMDDELVRSYPSSIPLRVRLTQPRNPRAMRYYFALLTLVKENLPEPSPSVEVLHEAVKVMLGYTLTVKTPRGDVVLPGSIAFDKMSEPEFRQYLESFKQLVMTRIIPGIDMPQFERAAREMLGAPLEAARRTAVRDAGAAPPAEGDVEVVTLAQALGAGPDDDDTFDDAPFGAPEPDEEDEEEGPFGAPPPPDDNDDGPFRARAGAETQWIDHARNNDASITANTMLTTTRTVDDTVVQLAQRRARDGSPRETPPGLDKREAAIWLDAYDAVKEGRDPKPPPPRQPEVVVAEEEYVDPDTGEVFSSMEEMLAAAQQREAAALAPHEDIGATSGGTGAEPEVVQQEVGESKAASSASSTRSRRRTRTSEASPETSPASPTASDASPPAPEGEKGLEEKSPATSSASLESEPEAYAQVRQAPTWPALKKIYQEGLQDGDYAAMENEGRRMYRMAVWERLEALAETGATGAVPAPTQDYDAMWLWLEFGAETRAEIDSMWPAFWRGAGYSRATHDDQSAIAGLMLDRQKVLK